MLKRFNSGAHCLILSFIVLWLSPIALAQCPPADLTGDCVVDLADLVFLGDHWLSSDLFVHPNLVARWRLDETTGETAADDVSGYHGQLHGDPQWMPSEGYRQGALFFDGVDDYVEITGYKGITGTASRTCSAWISTASTQAGVIISWGEEQNGQKWMFRLESNGTLSVGVWVGYITSTIPVNDDEWHHVAAVLADDGTPDVSEILLYIDGVLQDTNASNSQIINTAASQDVMIGAYSNAGQIVAPFNGLIDDVRIYNEALDSIDIQYLYRYGSSLRHNPDFTGDNQIDIADFAFLSQDWGRQEPAVVISEFLASNDAANPPVAEEGQIRDGDGQASDWLEIYNQTDFPIDLGGWALSDDSGDLFQWEFPPNTILDGESYMVLFASGQSNSNYPYVDSKGYLHTNFKLSASGEYLSLTRPEGTVEFAYDSVLGGFPEQVKNISYGILYGDEYYFALPTPGMPNRQQFLGFVDAPHFSHERGFYQTSFTLSLTSETPGAVIRYTTDGTDPTLSNGMTYAAPINVTVPTGPTSLCVRAAAFKPGYAPSEIKTKTYLLNATDMMKGLPAICLSGSPTQTFYSPNGIMAIVGGAWNDTWYKISPTDYNNVLGHGMDFERSVSMEYVNPAMDIEFQEDCGIRVHGSAWMRPRYTRPVIQGRWYYPYKYSFRLYFRGLYGNGKLRHPVLEQFPEVDEMDTLVLRAGHNDDTNPFVRDEMIRRLQHYTGHRASLGTFVNLFVNGDYKGYYNLCERIDEDFCQLYFDSNKEWDVVGWVQPGNVLEARDGDMVAFKEYINYARSNDLTNPVHYNEVIRQLDLEAFIDYIIVQCWGGNWDWPQNNWSAAAERSPDRKWRFFVWDAEGCMDGDLYSNRFNNLNSDSSDLSRLYRALKTNEDFRILFADRLQKHFLESDSVMRKDFLDSVFGQLAEEVKGVIPNINSWIPGVFIPGRESVFFDQCTSQSLFTFAGPRFFLDGREINKQDAVQENSLLTFQKASGTNGDIYFTLDGTDPRASIDQRFSAVTLVAENAPKRVLVPTGNIGTNWRSQIGYNDTSWNAGLPADASKTGGVGYERDTGSSTSNVPYISYNVHDAMFNQRTTAYIRIPFTVDPESMADWNFMTLSMRYDDGFVAYINGTEVCRRSFSGTPAWNSAASGQHENNGLEEISLNAYLSALQPGENLLAIHGLNVDTTSSDFVISAILKAGYTIGGNGISPRAQKYTGPVALDKNAHIKARTLNGGTWSAVREAKVVVGYVNETLRISELLYHPAADPNEEFIELTNTGTDPINLKGVSFTDGIDYTFGDMTLDPGQFLLLVRDLPVFENRYGTGFPVVGQYGGALDNAGERLELSDLFGNTIQVLDYDDDWYEITDGDGFSLNVVDAAYDQAAEIVAGAVAHWSFNESSGTTVLDETGNYPGMIFNMQNTNRVLGQEYKALKFDGIDDYVRITGYKGISGTASRTCSAWVQMSGNQGGMILSWGSEQNGQKWTFRVEPNGTLGVGVWGGYITSLKMVNDGQWHQVAAVLSDDGSLDVSEILLYIDGVLQDTYVSNAQSIDTGVGQDVLVGVFENAGVLTSHFSGLIDDVRIYDRALTGEEVQRLAEGVSWSRKDLWRPSAIRGGTPGRAEMAQEQLPLPGSVVINELLSHSHGQSVDWVELYNTTDQNIAIGGWFISDAFSSDADRKKYQIPAGVVLTPANPYYVVDESQFNNVSAPGCRIPFAFSEGGETAYLQSGTGEELTGYFVKEAFDAAESDVSFGRHEKTTGNWNFVPMSAQTPGAANAYPKVGPIIMTEIMYHPGPDDADKDCEYIELMNISNQPARTASYVSTSTGPTTHYDEWIPWRFTDGIAFEFPVDLVLDPGERILLVKDIELFNAKYSGIPVGTLIMEWTTGSLDNAGEKLQLSMPGDQEYGEDRYYIRADRVNYDDEGDWPEAADGTGKSLTHIRPEQVNQNYTNDAGNWVAADPTPGW